MARIPDTLAQETENQEQEDNDQAQDVADDAFRIGSDSAETSERGGRPNPAAILPDDVPDLVEKMEEMVTSGLIDNGAFAGEPMHDDEEGRLGQTDEDEDDEEQLGDIDDGGEQEE